MEAAGGSWRGNAGGGQRETDDRAIIVGTAARLAIRQHRSHCRQRSRTMIGDDGDFCRMMCLMGVPVDGAR